MLRIQSFTFNPFQENTYLLFNEEKQCWIIDPGMYDNTETKQFNEFISTNNLIPQAIINTHAHLDHIFGVQSMKDKYEIPFMIHEKELPVLKNGRGTAALFGFDFPHIPQADSFIKETERLNLNKNEIEVRFTPGHSPGSVVFYLPEIKSLIGGDVLFLESIGRTDLPGGDFETLLNSIRQELFTLPDDTTVYPGHGPATTIGNEKKHNPFLK